MLVTEFKLYGTQDQFTRIDECIRTTQFIRNKCLRLWMNEGAKPKDKRAKIGKYEFYAQAAVLAEQYGFAAKLNSTGRQAATERAWSSVSRFYENCKKKTRGKKGYPKFKNNVRSFELKQSGWLLSDDNKRICFGKRKPKDHEIGWLKLKGGRPLTQEHIDKWGWKVQNIDGKDLINFPDWQHRIFKNNGTIKWKNKVHEVLEGYKTLSYIPAELFLWHHKDIKRQEKQNAYYDTL